MIEFAEQLGAVRSGRPDWYAVAEHLAEIARPDLLKDVPVSNPVGKPKGPSSDLFIDVQEVRRQKKCSANEACRLLVKGEHPHRFTKIIGGKSVTFRMASGAWKGKNWKTLAQRYKEHIGDWRKTFK